MSTEVDQARHAHERGVIIRTLKEDYTSSMTSVRSLVGALDLQGISLASKDLEFHLIYLSDAGYVRVWRAKEMPGYRKDRRASGWIKGDTIMFARLTPKGLQLLDGLIPEDPLVLF